MIQDDRKRAFKVPLPPSLSAGMTLGYSTLLIVPAFLPGRHLAARFLPIVVHPDQDLLTVLPQTFWGEDLKATWLEWEAG